ncbi:hypothetical protein FXO38_02685 [Capsicum annuum]|nr:hypothetical protein FXO38_02685 [Capsicum annuum]KAF3683245.1 hypothetical protein FXO37_01971 [Capsicum annuum]
MRNIMKVVLVISIITCIFLTPTVARGSRGSSRSSGSGAKASGRSGHKGTKAHSGSSGSGIATTTWIPSARARPRIIPTAAIAHHPPPLVGPPWLWLCLLTLLLFNRSKDNLIVCNWCQSILSPSDLYTGAAQANPWPKAKIERRPYVYKKK